MGESIPAEVVDQLRKFNETLSVVEDALQPHLNAPTESNTQMRLLDRARVDVMSLFAINSLYWILLCTRGRNPKENESLNHELTRTKQCMERLKQLESRSTAPKLNLRAATSFVRNALWEPTQQNSKDTAATEEEVIEEPVTTQAESPTAAVLTHKRCLDESELSTECVVKTKKVKL